MHKLTFSCLLHTCKCGNATTKFLYIQKTVEDNDVPQSFYPYSMITRNQTKIATLIYVCPHESPTFNTRSCHGCGTSLPSAVAVLNIKQRQNNKRRKISFLSRDGNKVISKISKLNVVDYYNIRIYTTNNFRPGHITYTGSSIHAICSSSHCDPLIYTFLLTPAHRIIPLLMTPIRQLGECILSNTKN